MVCSVFLVTSSPSIIVYTILVMSCLSTLMILKTSIAYLCILAERLIIYYTPSNLAVRSLKLFCLLHIVSHFMELFPGFFVLNRLNVSKLYTFNNVLRKIWNLPKLCHTRILHCVAGVQSVYNTLVHLSSSAFGKAIDSGCGLIRHCFLSSSASVYTFIYILVLTLVISVILLRNTLMMISPVLISFVTFVLTYCRLILLSSLILLCIQFVVTRF